MCKKSAQDLTVSINDIITVLHALKDVHSASLELIEEITRYQEGDLTLLLSKGLEPYNQKQISLGKNRVVTCTTVFADNMRTSLIDPCLSFLNLKISSKNLFTLIPNELHTLIHSSLSWTSSISLSITCKKNYVIFERLVMPVFLTREGGNSVTSRQSAKTLFRENRDYRLCDRHKIIGQDGIDYVQHKLGLNCGPNTIQKIKNGDLTITQARETLENDLKKLVSQYDAKSGRKFLFSKDTQLLFSLKYIADGSLTEEVFYSEIVIPELGVQKYLDNGKLTMKQYIAIEYYERVTFASILANKAVQKYLDNGKLTMSQLCGLFEETFLVDEYFRTRRIFALTNTLENKVIQKYLDSNKIIINQIIQLLGFDSYYSYEKMDEKSPVLHLCNLLNIRKIEECINKDVLTIDEIAKINPCICGDWREGERRRIDPYSLIKNNAHLQEMLGRKLITIKKIEELAKSKYAWDLAGGATIEL
jgi:hypothetical protein